MHALDPGNLPVLLVFLLLGSLLTVWCAHVECGSWKSVLLLRLLSLMVFRLLVELSAPALPALELRVPLWWIMFVVGCSHSPLPLLEQLYALFLTTLYWLLHCLALVVPLQWLLQVAITCPSQALPQLYLLGMGLHWRLMLGCGSLRPLVVIIPMRRVLQSVGTIILP